jgi:adenylate cyclase
LVARLVADGDFEDRAGSDPERATVAIAFADVLGYSALMAQDEQRTYTAWVGLLARLIEPAAQRAGGRIVQVMGDGVLAEFPDPAAALTWAEAVQRGTAEQAALAAGDTPITLRIAVHFGTVTRHGSAIFGDDVNIAARLQDHAEPGGILLSEAARTRLGDRLTVPVRDLGHLALKNIDHPVRAFALGAAAASAVTQHAPTVEAVLPSIAVLPFQGETVATEDAYFASGVVEDVIHSLSGLRELRVIARGSTLAAAATTDDPREIGRLLSVRYVLSGRVARRGNRVRVVAELAEAEHGTTLWVEHAEVGGEELFELQERLVEHIVARLAPLLRKSELDRAMRKRPGSIGAYDFWLRAIDLMGSLERERFLGARTMLDRALAADPRFAMAAAWSARWHTLAVGQGWSSDVAADRERGMEMARRALTLDPQNAVALSALGHLNAFLLHAPLVALAQHQAALEACPNLAQGWMFASATYSYLHRGTEAVRHAEQAMRLSPMDQWRFQFSCFRGLAHYAHDDPEAALEWLTVSQTENPNYTSTLKLLAAAGAAAGRMREACAAARLLLEREPGFRVEPYIRERQPFRDQTFVERYRRDLLRAGLPE